MRDPNSDVTSPPTRLPLPGRIIAIGSHDHTSAEFRAFAESPIWNDPVEPDGNPDVSECLTTTAKRLIPEAPCGHQGCVFMPHPQTPDAHTHTANYKR